MNEEDEKDTIEDFLSDEEVFCNGVKRLVLNVEKDNAKKQIAIKSINFGLIVVAGSFFALFGNNLVEKLVLVTPYALIGGRSLQIIDEQRYKIKCINHELKGLKR